MILRLLIVLIGLTTTFGGPAEARQGSGQRCTMKGVGQDSFCDVNGVRLHIVDWGGDGPPLILLSGLGDSARIFDELAPLLARKNHVYAFTRRGFGPSAATPDSYGSAALVRDIVGLMEALRIASANFVGHSVAGGEISNLAADHPKRVLRIVYLDAAYDRSPVFELGEKDPLPGGPPPDALKSLTAYAAWKQSTLGVSSPAVVANSTAMMVVGANGTPTPRVGAGAGLSVLKGDVAAKPRYTAIKSPALAIYSGKLKAEQVPPNTPPNLRRAALEYTVRWVRPWMLREQARFLEEVPCGTAVEVPDAGHYLFLERPSWTAALVQAFLIAPQPCQWRPSN